MIIFASEQIAASMKKRWIVFTVLLIVALTAFLYIRFFFVFGEGVKSGELNYVVYKGLVFKTYEGKLIQSGIRSKTAGTIQSYEFEFSVENEALARKLMLLGGNQLGFEATFRVAAYSKAASVIALLPFCGGIVALIWELAIDIIGLYRIHGTDPWRAMVAVLGPALICISTFGAALALVIVGMGLN